ncbi:hypothetical protein EYC94_26055 [Enterobacter hormaechei]|nr:hypothetical protein EYC94_26055 [Enterobacter hormaechei]
MAEENQNKIETSSDAEIKDRGLFDFLSKKKEDEKPQEEAIAAEFDQKVTVSGEPAESKKEEGEKKHSLLEKLHRSDSSSSSSSEEEDENGEKRKKKKKEKKVEKKQEDTSVPVEKVGVDVNTEEKKGFLEKIKEKFPGNKKTDEVPTTTTTAPPAPVPVSSETSTTHHENEGEAKKGILEKIKEKLPGYHAKTTTEEHKDHKDDSAAAH